MVMKWWNDRPLDNSLVWHFFRWILAGNLHWHLWRPGGWEQKPRQLAKVQHATERMGRVADFLKTWTNNDQYLLISAMVGKMWSFLDSTPSWSYNFFLQQITQSACQLSSCFAPKPKFSLQVISFLFALKQPRHPGDVAEMYGAIPRCRWRCGQVARRRLFRYPDADGSLLSGHGLSVDGKRLWGRVTWCFLLCWTCKSAFAHSFLGHSETWWDCGMSKRGIYQISNKPDVW